MTKDGKSSAPPSNDAARMSAPCIPVPLHMAPQGYEPAVVQQKGKGNHHYASNRSAIPTLDRPPSENLWAYELFLCCGDMPSCLLQLFCPCVNEVIFGITHQSSCILSTDLL